MHESLASHNSSLVQLASITKAGLQRKPHAADNLCKASLKWVCSCVLLVQDWGDVVEPRDHPGSRKRRSGEDLIQWTPIQQSQLK